MAKALLLIDLSKDFVYLDGALNCGQPGVDIIPYCRTLVEQVLKEGAPVIDARDLHNLTDYEIASGLFPPHNIAGTPGQDLIDELASVLRAYPNQWVYIPKTNYNAVFRTELRSTLERLQVDEVHVIGVCTDICVRYTVNGLYEWKTSEYHDLRIVVHSQGVASFNPVGHEDSLRHFPAVLGAQVI